MAASARAPHNEVWTAAAQIPLAMLLVFASAKIMAEIFERLGQPGIVGEILAGVLIGPHVLGLAGAQRVPAYTLGPRV